MSKLFQLQKRYRDRLHLKLTGGHSKYFACDRKFAYVASHNILSSTIPNLKIAYPDLKGDETGTIHRNLEIIQKLITRYDQAIDLKDSNMLSTPPLHHCFLFHQDKPKNPLPSATSQVKAFSKLPQFYRSHLGDRRESVTMKRLGLNIESIVQMRSPSLSIKNCSKTAAHPNNSRKTLYMLSMTLFD